MHQDVLEESAILERRRSNWFLKRGIIKNAKMEKVLFRKNVDLSLIERGFTVPQSAVNSFCENIIGDVPLGSRLYIGLVVDNKTYSVTLSNVGFTSDTGQQMQVRYGPTSPIVDALRMIFAKSHTSLSEGRCPDDKEYVEVIAVTPNIFSLVCHPIDEKSVSSTLPDASLARGSLKQTESYLPGYNEMNIGAYVREKMRQLSDSGFIFTEQQLRDICDIQWSNENLKHEEQYPFATIVDRPFPFNDLVNDEDRYWDQIFPFGDVNLIISKNWHECSRVSFDKWLSTLEAEPSDANNYQEENKYDLLKQWLIKNGEEVICISFSEIANYVGGLPPSAYKCRSFWSNNDSHPFSAAWFDAGYNLAECDLETQYILFEKCSVRPGATCTRPITVEASLIEFSNKYRGQIKTKQEIVEKLSANYGHNKDSILPDEYEAASKNDFSKLFRRIDDGTYECLGYNSAQSSDTVTSDNEKEKTINLIATRFKNGIRKSSNIDFERFKNLYADEYGREFQHDSDWFNNLLTTEAFIYDDRAYIYRDEAVDSIRLYLEEMGSPCIYIDLFYERFLIELYAFSIFSVDMLRVFIEKNYSDISVKRNYILLQENISPSDLIKKVFSERETWSFDEIQERLPCLKMDTLRQTMDSAEYFRVEKGTYTHIDNIDLPDDEGVKIRTFVSNKLRERDYVIANELDLSKFIDLNPHCSFAAIRDAVFYKFLSSRYEKSGQVITHKGSKLRVLDIMEQYCREAGSVSFEELNAFEATFDPEGRTHSQCLIAGYNTMIRVSADLFVSDSQVEFDVAGIDEAIALYCHEKFIPLRGITDFSLFPFTGFSWNLFLLESYVRRFSRVFKYDVRAVNSANIGAIVRKSFDYDDYNDILAYALAKSLVRLSDKHAVGNYLFDNGYIGWRVLGKSESKILKSAKALREGGKV